MRRRSPLRTLWGFLFILAAGWAAAGRLGLAAGLACAAGTALAGFYMLRKIGGLTGDTLGAACEIVELIPLLVAVAGIQRGLIP